MKENKVLVQNQDTAIVAVRRALERQGIILCPADISTNLAVFAQHLDNPQGLALAADRYLEGRYRSRQ